MSTVLVLEARFYEDIADQLAGSAVLELEKAGYKVERLAVPGCFELPGAIAMANKAKKYAGFVALGCVIRGQTTHYDYVCQESARGLNDLAISKKLAIGYGVITAENREQAYARSDREQKDVGGRAAKACIRMMELKKQFMEK